MTRVTRRQAHRAKHPLDPMYPVCTVLTAHCTGSNAIAVQRE
jgi:hypothetical protein